VFYFGIFYFVLFGLLRKCGERKGNQILNVGFFILWGLFRIRMMRKCSNWVIIKMFCLFGLFLVFGKIKKNEILDVYWSHYSGCGFQ
jgi:hypothetical protein